MLIGLALAFLLIPTFGIMGVIVGTVVSRIPSLFLGLHWIWKHYNAKTDWASSIMVVAASGIAAVITHLFLAFFVTAVLFKLVAGGIVFVLAYIVVAPSIGAIVQDDITNLRVMLSGLGFISKLANIPLLIIEKVAKLVFALKNRNR